MQVLLSMIIPVFNIQKELKVLLNQLSLIRSTEIEIILVDDGSTDGSSNLVDKFAKKVWEWGNFSTDKSNPLKEFWLKCSTE